jgi:hypothetical protein
MRRDFLLSEEDTEWLNGRGLQWETLIENSTKWIFLRRYPIPGGYNAAEADTPLRLPPLYPVPRIGRSIHYVPVVDVRQK